MSRITVRVGGVTIIEQVTPDSVTTVSVSYGPWLRWLWPLRVRVRIRHGTQ